MKKIFLEKQFSRLEIFGLLIMWGGFTSSSVPKAIMGILVMLFTIITATKYQISEGVKTEKRDTWTEELAKKKLRFVARATLQNVRGIVLPKEDLELAEDRAEQVFYADDVI